MTSIRSSGVFILNLEQIFQHALVFSFVDFVNAVRESVSYSIDTRSKLNGKINIIISISYDRMFEKIILRKFNIFKRLTIKSQVKILKIVF